MLAHIRPAFVLLGLFTIATGLAYPFAVTGLAQTVAPSAAGGSLVVRDGRVIGSMLIGQDFTADRYFHGRPSATVATGSGDPSARPYNAEASAGSNLAPSSSLLQAAIARRAAALGEGPAPADLVTASGSGLDPDISPEAALRQVARIAKARNLSEAVVRDSVLRAIAGRQFFLLGEPHVNVLALNLALDALSP